MYYSSFPLHIRERILSGSVAKCYWNVRRGRALLRQRGEVELLRCCWINLASLAVYVYNERNYIRDERSWGNFKAAKGNKPMENDEVRPHMPHAPASAAPARGGFSLSEYAAGALPHQKSLKMLQKLIQSGTLKASKAIHASRQTNSTAGALGTNSQHTRAGVKMPRSCIYSKLFLHMISRADISNWSE